MNEQAKKRCDWPGCGAEKFHFTGLMGGWSAAQREEMDDAGMICPNADQHGELEKPQPFSVERMQAELDACKDLSRIGNMQVPKEYCHRLLVTYAVEKERADKAEAELEVKQQKVIRQKKELAFLNGRVDEYIDNYKYECRKTLKLKADYAVLHGVLQKLHEIVAHNEPPGRDLPLEWIMEEAQKLLASPHPGADLPGDDPKSRAIIDNLLDHVATDLSQAKGKDIEAAFERGALLIRREVIHAIGHGATFQGNPYEDALRQLGRVKALEGVAGAIVNHRDCDGEGCLYDDAEIGRLAQEALDSSEPKETPSQELALYSLWNFPSEKWTDPFPTKKAGE